MPNAKQSGSQTLSASPHAEASVHRIIVAMEGQRGELPVEELLALRFQRHHRRRSRHPPRTPLRQNSARRPAPQQLPLQRRLSHPARRSSSPASIVSMCAAAVGSCSLLPFFPFVLLVVRFSSKGPIFFRQTRVGVGGRTFNVIKFRSMFTDAEAGGAQWATKNDPRVTKIGMFMRKTRIDEVPQLWNVLRGDMGFVGPRPERPEFVPMLTEDAALLLPPPPHPPRPHRLGAGPLRLRRHARRNPRKARVRPLLRQAHVARPRPAHHVRNHQDHHPPPRRAMKPLFWLSLFWLSLGVILYTYAGYPLVMALLARLHAARLAQSPLAHRRRSRPSPSSWPSTTEPPAPRTNRPPPHPRPAPRPRNHHRLRRLDRRDATKSFRNAHRPAPASHHPRRARPAKPPPSTTASPPPPARSSSSSTSAPASSPAHSHALLSNFADPTVGCVAGELLLNTEGHDATASAVSGLYWNYEQWIRNCEAAVDSPVGVYGGFYAIRRAARHAHPRRHHPRRHVPAPLDHPPGLPQRPRPHGLRHRHVARESRRRIPAQGPHPRRKLPAHRPRSLASHPRNRVALPARLPQTPAPGSPLLLRPAPPHSAILGLDSARYAIFAIAPTPLLDARRPLHSQRIPILHRLGTPAGALLVLNAAAVAGLYTFLFTRGPLWKIWSPTPTAVSHKA